MNRIKIEILCFILAIVLLVAGCFALSGYATAKVRAVKSLLDGLPADAEKAASRKAARRIEEELDEAGARLAYFVRYDHLNRAQSAASAFSAALAGDEPSEIENARRALDEALESLLRLEDCTPEIFL